MKTDHHPADRCGMSRTVLLYRTISPCLLIAVAMAIVACGKQSNPEFCADNVSCSDPKMFCDSLGESGSLQNECVFRPSCDLGCFSLVPICDVEENLCRSCTPGTEGDAECVAVAATTPLCSEQGSCIACTKPIDCRNNAAPDCAVDGSCQPCRPGDSGNIMCAERDATVPHCLDGTCVACLQKTAAIDTNCTDSTKPICEAYACRGCNTHEDCANNGVPGICTQTGSCLAKDTMVFVDANTKITDDSPCGEDPGNLACATINKALRLVAADNSTKTTIRVAPGTYPETFEITTDVLIVGEAGVIINPRVNTQNTVKPVVLVAEGIHAILDSIQINTESGQTGISCIDASVSLFHTELKGSAEQGSGNGIDAADCAIHVAEESVITAHDNVGIIVEGSTLTVQDSIVSNSDIGISIAGGAVTLKNSTVTKSVRGITVHQGNLLVQNSIVTNNDQGINASGETITLHNSEVSNNGIGITLMRGTLRISNSAVRGDGDPGTNDGILVQGGIARVQNTLITNNFPKEDPREHNFTGINISSGKVTIESSIVTNTAIGIHVRGGNLTLKNSTITNNETSGLIIQNSDFSVVNNFFVGNGQSSSFQIFSPVTIQNIIIRETPFQTFAFNTVYKNSTTTLATASGVSCATAKHLVAQNNIVFGNTGAPNVTPPAIEKSCSWEYSNIGGDTLYPGIGNVNSPPALDAKTFKLTTNSTCCIDTGTPDATVSEDFENQKRPQGEGYDIGADEFVP